jgi:L-iditol 2-dehydrogenase
MASATQVHALVLHGAQDLRLESRPSPSPTTTEVAIQIKATGLCGSDLHYYTHGRNGAFILQSPLVLGHEAAGLITSSSIPTLPTGTRVALEVGLPCRTCSLCTRGRYNLCSKLRFKSSAKTFPHADGTLQSTISHPADMVHVLPPNVTFEQGALIEPLAVSLHAINRSQQNDLPFAGSTALVLGAGAVGMLTAAALSVSGVSQILVADIDAPRLKIVEGLGSGKFGIKTFLLPRKPPGKDIDATLASAQELAKEVWDAAGLEGFDRVFECTGVPSCVQLGIYAASAGGKLVLVGMGTPVQTLPLGAAALREVDIVGVFRYANCYPAAIRLFASGKLDGVAEELVTHRVPLEEGEKAFRLAANKARPGEDEGRVVVKVVVTN